MLRGNFHTHTTFCDGQDTARAMAEQALALGFTALGFSGHMDTDIHMELPAYLAELRCLQEEYRGRLDILAGIELDTLYDASVGAEAEYLIGSTHFLEVTGEMPMSVDSSAEILEDLCCRYFGGDYYALTRAYYALEEQVVRRTGCDIVGHFDLISRFNDERPSFDEEDPRYYGPALEAMESLVRQGVPFEINCGAFNRGRKKDFYPNRRLLKALHDFGGRIMINSDAHQKELLAGGFLEAVEVARACGFREVLTLAHDAQGRVVFLEEAL